MNEKLPRRLLEKQESERQGTVEKVLRAIHDLKSEGCRLSIKNLMAYTELSRSVFAKPHVRSVLIEHGIVISQNKISSKSDSKNTIKDQGHKKDQRIQFLLKENEELKHECELLRSRLFLLLQKQQRELK